MGFVLPLGVTKRSPTEGESPHPRTVLLDALVSLMPHVASRKGLGFSAQEREDALMDAILRVLEARTEPSMGAHPVDGAARRYALAVVENQLLDRFRKERSHAMGLLEAEPMTVPREESPPTPRLAQLATIAQTLLASLKEDDRLLLEAYFDGEEALADARERLNLKPGAARTRVCRLLKALRERSSALVPG